jgi:uncharacterized protein
LITFFDSSALVKIFVQEEHSERVELCLASSDLIGISELTLVEVAAAVARRAREKTLTPAQRDFAVASLNREAASFYVVELAGSVVTKAQEICSRESLRAGDSIQLASCLALAERLEAPVIFATFDRRLSQAGERLGAQVTHLEMDQEA